MAETPLEQLLTAHRIPLTADQFVAQLSAVFTTVPDPAAAPLAAQAVQALHEHGGDLARVVVDHWDPAVVRTEQALAAGRSVKALMESTVDPAEAARLLGVDRSRIYHRLADGSLYGLRVGRLRRLPRWQFTISGELPGLRELLAVLRADAVSALTVDAFMHAAAEELDGETPLGYLAAGAPPSRVVEVLDELARW